MRTLITTFALAAALAVTTSAHADTFNFSYSGTGVTATGILTTVDPVGGAFVITGITGTRNGVTIGGLVDFNGPDDLLYPSDPFLTFNGFSFSAGEGVYNVFLSSFDGTAGSYVEEDSNGNDIVISLDPNSSLATAPEPGGLIFLGTGMLAAAGAARRRFRKA